jgi:hypothetical protein
MLVGDKPLRRLLERVTEVTDMKLGRHASLLLVALLVFSAVAPAGAVAAGVGTTDSPSQSPVFAQQESPQNETTTAEENETLSDDGSSADPTDPPGKANSVRITPIQFDEDWLGVSTTEADQAFNTTGPFVMLSLSEPAENVRIAQSKADARLLEGEQTIRVEYADDAAPTSGKTYFQVEIFFADGSSTTVDLYAQKTGVSASATEWEEYSGLIEQMQEDAVERGYAESPEGLKKYHEWQVDRVELVESFLVERASQLFASAILLAQNPLAWIIALLAIAVIAYKREQAHGWVLDRIENDAGETARKQEQMKAAYREHRQAANEEYIGELNEVNDQQAVYWSDAFDIWSVHQLAELARRGPRDLDANLVTDGGEQQSAIETVESSEIRDSWLATVFSSNRLSGPQETLSQMRAALIRMEATYGMGHIYGDTRSDVEQLLEKVRESEGGF